jgi:hypothetical protein
MKRRDFMTLLGGVMACPAGAQSAGLPLIGFVSARRREESFAPAIHFARGSARSASLRGRTWRSSTIGLTANTINCPR